MKIGIVSVTFRDKTTDELIELTKTAGLDAIEWGGDIHVPAGDFENARNVGVKTRQAGLLTPSYGSYYRAGTGEGDFKVVLETALNLGASNIRIWAGKKGSEEADKAYTTNVYEDLNRIVESAKKEGVTISAEYHQNTLTDTPEGADALLNAVDGLYSYWQVQSGRDEKENLQNLLSLENRLSNVHVQNISNPGWDSYIDYLKKLKFDRYLFLEFVKDNDPLQFIKDSKLLKEFVYENKI